MRSGLNEPKTCASIFTKYSIIYIIFEGKNEQSEENHHTVGQGQQKVNQVMLHKKDTGFLKGITDPARIILGTNTITFKGRTWVPESKLPQCPGPRPLMFLVLHKETYSFPKHHSLQESLRLA